MNQIKKLLCGVAMVCMVIAGICFIPKTVQAKTVSGNDGEIHWEMKGDTLTLSAVRGTKGRMKSYARKVIDGKQSWHMEYADTPWSVALSKSYAQNIKNIVIDKSITKLGSGAFSLDPSNDKFDSMEILCKADTIPSYFIAFPARKTIKKIIIGDSIKTIEEFALSNLLVKQLVAGKDVNINDANFIWSADGSYTNLQTVYTYRGSSAENMVKHFIRYAKETKKTGGVNSDDPNWNGTYFGILDGNSRETYSIKVVYLDKSTLLSKAKAPSSISVNKGRKKALKISLPAGLSQVTKYTGNPADVKVTFKSSNSKVAAVSSSGKVTGKKKGNAKITVSMQTKVGVNKKISIKVTVR